MPALRPARPFCPACQFYQITYQIAHPYACTILGFQTNKMPALEVLSSSGIICQHFEEKKKK